MRSKSRLSKYLCVIKNPLNTKNKNTAAVPEYQNAKGEWWINDCQVDVETSAGLKWCKKGKKLKLKWENTTAKHANPRILSAELSFTMKLYFPIYL